MTNVGSPFSILPILTACLQGSITAESIVLHNCVYDIQSVGHWRCLCACCDGLPYADIASIGLILVLDFSTPLLCTTVNIDECN